MGGFADPGKTQRSPLSNCDCITDRGSCAGSDRYNSNAGHGYHPDAGDGYNSKASDGNHSDGSDTDAAYSSAVGCQSCAARPGARRRTRDASPDATATARERPSRVVHDVWSTDCARGARGRWNLRPSNQQDQCEGSGRFWNGRAGHDVAVAGPDRTTIYNYEQSERTAGRTGCHNSVG